MCAFVAALALLAGAAGLCQGDGTKGNPIDLGGLTGPLVTVAGPAKPTTVPNQTGPCLAGIERYEWDFDYLELFPPAGEVLAALYGDPAVAPLCDEDRSAGSQASLALGFTAGGDTGPPAGSNYWGGRSGVYEYAESTYVTLGEADDFKEYVVYGTMYVSPLVLDPYGPEPPAMPPRDPLGPHPGNASGPFAAFDMNGDDFEEIVEWIPGNYYLLATKAEPKSGKDLVGTPGGWDDGFQHLAVYDTDGDTIVSGLELGKLYLWKGDEVYARVSGPALPVTDFGIVAIGTDSTDWVGRYTMLDPNGIPIEKEVWDFWPSYALANLVTYQDPPPPPPILPYCPDPTGKRCPKWIQELSRSLCKEKKEAPAGHSPGVTAPTLITREELQGTGIDLNDDLKIDGVAGGGSLIFASDRSAPPHRARLLTISLKPNGRLKKVDKTTLPFEEILQIAHSPDAGMVMVLGDAGSRLMLLERSSGHLRTVLSIDLKPRGIRASGVAGWDDGFWFTGWTIDGDGAAHAERVWKLECGVGIIPAMSIQEVEEAVEEACAVRRGIDPSAVRTLQRYITGPDEGYFVVSIAGQLPTEEIARWSTGQPPEVIMEGGVIGGLAAIPGMVAFTVNDGYDPVADVWQDRRAYLYERHGHLEEVASLPPGGPAFYPFLTPDGRGMVVTILAKKADEVELQNRKKLQFVPYGEASDPTLGMEPIDWPAAVGTGGTVHLGQTKVTNGCEINLTMPGGGHGRTCPRMVMVHYEPDGLYVIPLP